MNLKNLNEELTKALNEEEFVPSVDDYKQLVMESIENVKMELNKFAWDIGKSGDISMDTLNDMIVELDENIIIQVRQLHKRVR